MSQFAYLYRGGERPTSPDAAQQQMQRWGAWLKDLTEKGFIKDPGQPLDQTGKVVKGKDKRVITDGPYAEAKDIVGGFTVVEAKDLSHAVELSAGCPIFVAGGMVEVRPVMKM